MHISLCSLGLTRTVVLAGVKENSVFHFPASNVDVAPTMLGLAGQT